MFKSNVKNTSFFVFALAFFWFSQVQADSASKIENPTLEIEKSEVANIEEEPLESEEILLAQIEKKLPPIPFAARKYKKPEGDIRLGRFEIHPGASLTYKYDDNIFLNADQSFSDGSFESPTSDSVAILKGSLNTIKELKPGDSWGFEMFYEAQSETFDKNGSEDFLQHDLDTELTLAGEGGRTQITFFGNYFHTVSPATNQFASNFNPRSVRDLTELGEKFRWAISPRTVVNLNAQIAFQRFADGTLQREDRNNFTLSSSLLWAWTRLTSFGVNLLWDNTVYTQPQTFNNDSNLYGFLLIARFQPSAFISGDVGVGYQERHVAGAGDRGGFTYKLNLTYDYSDRTKFFLTGSRAVTDSTFQLANLNITTSLNLAWEQQWPLLPKFGTRAFLGYENLDFSEAQADTINGGGVARFRDDDRIAMGIDLVYNIQKWLDVELEYKRIDNDSNFEDRNFLSNVLTLSVKSVF